jgi:hypothetical protein
MIVRAAPSHAARAWIDRYRTSVSLSEGRHFELLTVVRASDREAGVVVRPGAESRPALALRRLTLLAEAHGAIDHPLVPRLAHLHTDPDAPFVELAADVATDARGLVRSLADQRIRLPYAQSLVLVDAVLDAMESAHRAGFVLGRLALEDVWLSPDGQPSVIGWGAHVTLERDDGSVDASLAPLEPPEVAAGAPITASHDFVVALLFARALAPLVQPPAAFARVLAGNPRPGDEAAVAMLTELDRRFLAQHASRPSFAEGRQSLAAVRRALGEMPDPDGLSRTVAATLARSAEHDVNLLLPQDPTEQNVVVESRGAWVDGLDGRTSLGPSLRAILAHLLTLHRERPGATTTLWELLAVGWPGEQPIPEAGANRVYAAIRRLRRTGLAGVLEWHEGGYRIVPAARLTTID